MGRSSGNHELVIGIMYAGLREMVFDDAARLSTNSGGDLREEG